MFTSGLLITAFAIGLHYLISPYTARRGAKGVVPLLDGYLERAVTDASDRVLARAETLLEQKGKAYWVQAKNEIMDEAEGLIQAYGEEGFNKLNSLVSQGWQAFEAKWQRLEQIAALMVHNRATTIGSKGGLAKAEKAAMVEAGRNILAERLGLPGPVGAMIAQNIPDEWIEKGIENPELLKQGLDMMGKGGARGGGQSRGRNSIHGF